MTEAIVVEDLRKSYKSKKAVVEAVKGISLRVEKGEIFGFLGPNGAGKTTSQRMLATLLAIDSGRVTIAGIDVKHHPSEVRRHIGYVGQLGGSDMSATGRENLLLAGRLYGMKKAEVEVKIRDLAEMFDLTDLLDRLVKTYSGGQRRRLEIALGIIHEPEILFLDEPTTGLDPQNRANLWAHILQLKAAGMTIFLTTHYLDEADNLCDHLAIMDRGKIIAEASPAALKSQISGDIITLKVKGETDNLLSNLAAQEFVQEVQAQANNLTLQVHNGALSLPKIYELVQSQSLEIESLSLSAPSLDDVFLKLTGRALRDGNHVENTEKGELES